MKNSEKLRNEANQEENDLAYMGKIKKSIREARLESFEESGIIESLERNNCIVIPFDGSKYTIDTQSDLKVIDFFPKSNKILIRKDNKWIINGLKWIKENLL